MLACKRFLVVPIRTPNKLVYGDLGRYPLLINSQINSIRYWFRILSMDEDRLPRKFYNLLVELDSKGKDCWVTNIRSLLNKTGFHFVWAQQGVGDVKLFLCELQQRLVDIFIQEWSGYIMESERYNDYRMFKSIFEKEFYIDDSFL